MSVIKLSFRKLNNVDEVVNIKSFYYIICASIYKTNNTETGVLSQ